MNAKLNAAQLFAASLHTTIKAANAGLAKFRKDFGTSPIRALEWADAVYHQATLVPIAKHVLVQIANGDSLAAISAQLQERVNTLASHTSHSTSPSAGLVERASLASTAQILREAQDYAAIAEKANGTAA